MTIYGRVKKFATITPKTVTLRGNIGSSIKQSVIILPEAAYPFKIIDVKAEKGTNIGFTWKPYNDREGSGYQLIVENLRKEKGRYFDRIILKTDSDIRPEIIIAIHGNILEDPQVTEAQPS